MRLLEAAERDDPDFAFFLILAGVTGARRGELCALRDSDFDRDVVTISRVLALGPGGPVEQNKRWRNEGRGRRVALAGMTQQMYAAQLERRRRQAAAFEIDLPADAFVFSSEVDGSRPWRPESMSRRFRLLRSRLGLGEVRLHDLRHFMVSSLLDAGIALPTVASRAGHADGGRTTLSVYGHRIDESDRLAAEVMERLLGVGQGG